jgi:hypothetical protein
MLICYIESVDAKRFKFIFSKIHVLKVENYAIDELCFSLLLPTMRIFFCFFILLGLVSCNADRLNVKVENIDIDLTVSRLDLELAHARNLSEIQKVHHKYALEHEEFYNFYLGACLQVGLIQDSLTVFALLEFVEDPYVRKLHEELKLEFSSTDDVIFQLKIGFSMLRHHFPDAVLPKHIIFYNSLFTNSVVSSENTIGVGLERYLGEMNECIKELPEDPFYPYIKRRMDRNFIVRDMMMSWLGSNVLPEVQDEKELADVMIQWGKHFYVLEACFPQLDKALILRYFPEEYDWAIKNEKEFWNYLVAQNCLFKRDYKMALNIFADGPFTSGLPIDDKAPPRLGQYLGWRIVKHYMNQNAEVSLQQMLLVDYKTIIKTYN